MSLQEVQREIALNGGMDIKQSTELQEETTLRAVTNLRWNALGELEKRPTYASLATPTPPSGSDYDSAAPEALFARSTEVFALTKDCGLVSVDPSDHNAVTWPDTSATNWQPRGCRVSRRLIERTQFSRAGAYILQVASALYGDDLVIAWIEVSSGGTYSLCLKAVDVNTGQVLVQTTKTGAQGTILSANVYSVAGSEGVVITTVESAAAPYTIGYVHYAAATRVFSNGTLTTNAKYAGAASADAGDGTGFYFAFTDNTSGFLTCQKRTLSTVLSTHTGTVADPRLFALVVHPNGVLIVTATTSNVYGERFGAPTDRITLFTASSETFYALTASLEDTATRDAIVYVNCKTTGVTPEAYYTRTARVTFSATTPVLGNKGQIPWGWTVSQAMSFDGRSYVAFALPTGVTSAFLCRYNENIASTRVAVDAVARLGHDRFYTFLAGFAGGVSSASVSGSKVHMVFMADASEAGAVGSAPAPQALFHATVEFAGSGAALPLPSVEIDGTAVIASGMPIEWDGSEVSEHTPIHPPIVTVDVSGGTGSTGTFSIIAIYRWVDAKGRLHRSAPSGAVTADCTGANANHEIKVYVAKPLFYSYRPGGAQLMEPEIYITADGGSTYWLAMELSGKEYVGPSSTSLWWVFDSVNAGTSAGPEIYTTGAAGEELTAEPPPAFLSICRLADRLWAIDAEDRSRIWFTKPIVTGFAPEWNTSNTLTIGDDGVAIADMNGVPTVFAAHGIWQINGSGPDANGVGEFFPALRLPFEVACIDPLICRTSVGVVFRAKRGFYILGQGLVPIGLPIDPSSRAPSSSGYSYARVVFDEVHNEIRIADAEFVHHWAYNVLEKKWSEWTQDIAAQNAVDLVQCDGRIWYIHANGSGPLAIRRELGVDESSYNTSTEPWTIETPWVRLDGVAGYGRLWDLLLTIKGAANMNRVSSFLVTLETRGATGENGTDTFSWTGAELAALGGLDDSIVLRCKPAHQRAKAIRLSVTETPSSAHAGSKPVALRLVMGVDGKAFRRSRAGAQKGAA